MGEIRMMGFNFAPKGWAQCNGQILAINQNQALFSLVGTYYGGDGIRTFALPDLRGRVPLHEGTGYPVAQKAGEDAHTVIITEMPQHTHQVNATSSRASVATPVANTFAALGSAGYGPTPDSAMAGQAVGYFGGSQAHENRSPFLAVNFCIALQGIYPSPT